MNTRNASGRPAGKLNRRSFLTKGLASVGAALAAVWAGQSVARLWG